MTGRLLGSALLLAVACPGVAFAGSAVVQSKTAGEVELGAIGCGVAASTTIPLPATTIGVQVRRPKVGATTAWSRLTEVAVLGASVRLTAVGAGTEICDPAFDPDIPPAEREWSGVYRYGFDYTERVQVAYWSGTAKPKAKPRKVLISGVARFIKIRWRSFGGRKAVGFGRIKAINPPGVKCTYYTCPGHGARGKVVLTRASRCPDIGDRVYYGRVSIYVTERARFMKKGELYTYTTPGCQFGKPRRV